MTEPRMVVFDLDFTLWDCGGLWVDCTAHPFREAAPGKIVDSAQRHLRLYPDVLDIMDWLDERNIPMALASRTEQPSWACDLLDALEIRKRFQFSEIYPGSKVSHFGRLWGDSGVDYDEMLFFDDELRNIHEVRELGVHSVEVRNGMSADLFHSTMEKFL